MKTSNFQVINLLLVLFTFFTFITQAQVGIGTTNPDASSMLDIESTSTGILIPRMTTVQRTAISSPANGLLVFDNTIKSFWYYNRTATTPNWQELSGSSISDTDGDTKIQVEENEDDDIIRLSTAGIEYIQIDSSGEIKLGNRSASTLTGGPLGLPEADATGLENYTKITADGSLSYVGNATRWEDLKVPVNSLRIRDKNAGIDIDPAKWDYFIGETALLWFENKNATAEQSVTFTVQLPHGWKEGTKIYPHVHWTSLTAPGSTRVTWGLEYSWVSLGGGFPDTTIITGTTVAAPNSGSIAAKEHIITPLGAIDGTGNTLSSMLVCRLFRNSSTGTDDFSGNAALLEFDFHYQVDSDGSNQEYTKE